MNTYTDSERLAFLVSQGYDCSAISNVPNWRAVIDRSIDAWNERLCGIVTGAVVPSKEATKPRKFADKDHPAGYFSGGTGR